MTKHPDLSKKLQSLYSLRVNPEIQSNVDLAEQLNVSRQAVSRWCCGTPTQRGNSIPDHQLVPLADAFDIEPYWLAYEFTEFSDCVRSKLTAEKSGPVEKVQHVSIATLPITGLDIFGRDGEISRLNNYWQNGRTNIVQIVAFGGVGKSSLVNRWLSEISKDHYRHANRVYAWSFYWQGHSSDIKSSGDFFIENALEWFGDENPDKGTPWAKAARLADLIRSHRTLLVLDGLEPLQSPPGPREGIIENPGIALLIRELASDNRGLCVLTSRLPVTDLESFRDGRVETIDLQNLCFDDGTYLLRNLGIKGNRDIYARAVNAYAGHPLSLSLLAGYLNVAHDGDIESFYELQSLMEEEKNSDHVSNIMTAYLGWFEGKPERELLYFISIFDRAVSLSDLQEISKNDTASSLTTRLNQLSRNDWYYGISLLSDAKLISKWKKDGEIFLDCHPIVRDFVSGFLAAEKPDVWEQAHSLLFDFLLERSKHQSILMEELELLFRAVMHGASAKRYDEAFAVYYHNIKNRQFSISTEVSHHADHACLRAFFEKPWVVPVQTLAEDAQMYLLASAATNFIYLGKIKEALQPCYTGIQWFLENQRWDEAAAAAAPLASMLIAAGELSKAGQLIEDLSPAIEGSQNDVVVAMARNFKAYIYYLQGDLKKADKFFKKSDEVITRLLPPQTANSPTISSYYCKYLMDTGKVPEALDRALKTAGWRRRESWQVEIDTTSLLASDTLVQGLIFMELGDFNNARRYLDRQVDLFRSLDEWLYLPTGLNYRARFLIRAGELAGASLDLTESIEISKRTGARFGQWEAYIELASLHLEQQDFSECAHYLDMAAGMEGMEAYRFRDAEVEAMRAALP